MKLTKDSQNIEDSSIKTIGNLKHMGLNTNDFNQIRTYHKVNKNKLDNLKEQANELQELNDMFKKQTDIDINTKKCKRKDPSQNATENTEQYVSNKNNKLDKNILDKLSAISNNETK